MKIKRALLSVWDKEGIVDLASFLSNRKIELLSTGGTKSILEDNGLIVKSIEDFGGSGSIMDGRIKTLHPNIFGGILADRKNPSHISDLELIGSSEIDLVIVNFYPFVEEAIQKKLDFKKAIEFIDIGGPSMVRAAAKNYNSVVSLCDPAYYKEFVEVFNNNNGDIPLEYRQKCAASVFSITSSYESAINNFFNKDKKLPDSKIIELKKISDLRYGENPHQDAAFYISKDIPLPWKQYQGKELSYNNYSDMESAYNIANEHEKTACAIIKHSNPCGFGLADSAKDAFTKAVSTDPVSYFGGIVGFNCEVDTDVSKELIKPFLECIIAPSFSNSALEILKSKKNLRLISMQSKDSNYQHAIKSVLGGYLYQDKDRQQGELNQLDIVTKNKPNQLELESLHLGWKLVRHVKSNAIVLSDNTQLLGVGAGQMSRIDSVKIAIQKVIESGLNLDGAIMASDAFFPFSDSIELAAKAGVKAVIQPGGSMKDNEVIDAANKLNISMVFTGTRHFLH